jgi:hypothetical protein
VSCFGRLSGQDDLSRLDVLLTWVLPGARSNWADAMRRELDYIEDDRAALRWADLSREKVGGFPATGNQATKTALRGWPYRIRTSMCRVKIHLFEHASILGFEALGQTVPPPWRILFYRDLNCSRTLRMRLENFPWCRPGTPASKFESSQGGLIGFKPAQNSDSR